MQIAIRGLKRIHKSACKNHLNCCCMLPMMNRQSIYFEHMLEKPLLVSRWGLRGKGKEIAGRPKCRYSQDKRQDSGEQKAKFIFNQS